MNLKPHTNQNPATVVKINTHMEKNHFKSLFEKKNKRQVFRQWEEKSTHDYELIKFHGAENMGVDEARLISRPPSVLLIHDSKGLQSLEPARNFQKSSPRIALF